jgi:hypothetical protein
MEILFTAQKIMENIGLIAASYMAPKIVGDSGLMATIFMVHMKMYHG